MRQKNDFLKLIAIITMTIDHIGAIILPEHYILRIIGRIAFPIFAYQITVGFRHTDNIKKYFLRILIFSLVSQIPYSIILPGSLNIGFTLLVGLLIIYFWERKDGKVVSMGLMFILGFVPDLSYGSYGLFMILIFHLTYGNAPGMFILQAFNNLFYLVSTGSGIQFYSLISMFLINRKWKVKIALPKYLFYFYYPIHLSVIYYINLYLL